MQIQRVVNLKGGGWEVSQSQSFALLGKHSFVKFGTQFLASFRSLLNKDFLFARLTSKDATQEGRMKKQPKKIVIERGLAGDCVER